MIPILMAGECQSLSSRSSMIQEEDDMTQEIRQLVLLEVNAEIQNFINKIEQAKIKPTDEWGDGLNQGLDWAIRILKKDKSAY
jgi:hypothetical protein